MMIFGATFRLTYLGDFLLSAATTAAIMVMAIANRPNNTKRMNLFFLTPHIRFPLASGVASFSDT